MICDKYLVVMCNKGFHEFMNFVCGGFKVKETFDELVMNNTTNTNINYESFLMTFLFFVLGVDLPPLLTYEGVYMLWYLGICKVKEVHV